MGEIRETDPFTSERDNYSNAIYRLEKEIASSQSELSKIRMKISDKESDIRNLDQIIQLNYNESNVIDNKLSSCCDKLLKYKKSMILFLIAFLVIYKLSAYIDFSIISFIFLVCLLCAVFSAIFFLHYYVNRKSLRYKNDSLRANLQSDLLKKQALDSEIGELFKRNVELESKITDHMSNIEEFKSIMENYNNFNKLANDFKGKYGEVFDESFKFAFYPRNSSTNKLFTYLAKFDECSCYKSVSLLSEKEKMLYTILNKFCQNKSYLLFSKVRFMDIINLGTVTSQYFNNEKNKENVIEFYQNIIKSKHIDFVLYNSNFKPILCIELDDESHFNENNKFFSYDSVRNQIQKDLILSYCKIPLLRIDIDNINNLINTRSYDSFHNKITDCIRNKQHVYFYTEENVNKFKSVVSKYHEQPYHVW